MGEGIEIAFSAPSVMTLKHIVTDTIALEHPLSELKHPAFNLKHTSKIAPPLGLGERGYPYHHARRKLHDVTQSGAAPIAQEGLAQIQALYRIEKDLRGQPADQRRAARQEHAKSIIDDFERWLAQSRARVSAKSPTGEALKYIAKYWEGLCRFLEDGRIELDSNAVERTIRPIALNRKNALLAGHDAGAQNWAMIASLIESCKLNAVDPHAWLVATLTAIAGGHKQSDIDALLPWNYKGDGGEGQGHEHHRIEGHA